jgi:hypothetical protein
LLRRRFDLVSAEWNLPTRKNNLLFPLNGFCGFAGLLHEYGFGTKQDFVAAIDAYEHASIKASPEW